MDFFLSPPLTSVLGNPVNRYGSREKLNNLCDFWMPEDDFNWLIKYVKGIDLKPNWTIEHYNALPYIEKAVHKGELNECFSLINLDAHSDLYRMDLDKQINEANWVWFLSKGHYLKLYTWVIAPKDWPDLKNDHVNLPPDLIFCKNQNEIALMEHKISCLQKEPKYICSFLTCDSEEEFNQAKTIQQQIDELTLKRAKLKYHSMEAKHLDKNFNVQKCSFSRSIFPNASRIGNVTISISPGYTPKKIDRYIDRLKSAWKI